MAFPTTGVLDDFNRADEGGPPSASWTANGIVGGSSTMAVRTNEIAEIGASNGAVYGTQYGPDCEMYLSHPTLPINTQRTHMLLRLTDAGTSNNDGYWVQFARLDANPGFTVKFYRMTNGGLTQLGSTYNDTDGAIAAGIKWGVDMVGTTITAYVNRSGSWASATSNTGDATYTLAGYLGLAFDSTTPRGDDFGGGNVVTGPPAAVQVPITVMHGNYW